MSRRSSPRVESIANENIEYKEKNEKEYEDERGDDDERDGRRRYAGEDGDGDGESSDESDGERIDGLHRPMRPRHNSKARQCREEQLAVVGKLAQ